MRSKNKKPAQSMWAVGLMTGTALDGQIDVALLKCDGENIKEFGEYLLEPYQTKTISLLQQCQAEALDWRFQGPEPTVFASTEKQITLEQANAVKKVIAKAGLSTSDIGVVGFHGQTVLHRAPVAGQLGRTRQLGDGALLAQLLGIPVVNDFRSADMLKGGQGAPLCAVYHQALLASCEASDNCAVLNLGGVGNITWWDGGFQLVAFDTGPANAPINDFVQQMGAGQFDVDGKLALAGEVDEVRLAALLEQPYFRKAYPKSLDRVDFSWRMAQGYPLTDGAALLTAFSAAAVHEALELLPTQPDKLIVCGGGRRNPALMQALRDRTHKTVIPAETMGWRGDAIEAECFAYIAVRTMIGLASSYPTTTGASLPTIAGVLHEY